MSLQCNITLSYHSYSAGQNPPPMATLQVYNPNASAVAVTGIAMQFFDVFGNALSAAINPPMPAMGPGQTVVAPAASSITFGPFPIAVGSAANANSFYAVPAGSPPINPQEAQPPQTTILVGALVYGSDGSINAAGQDGLLVSYTSAPPPGFQGGALQFGAPNNIVTGLTSGVL